MQNGRVYTMQIPAGRHAIATSENPTGIEVDIEAGKEYFIRIDYATNASFAIRATPVVFRWRWAGKRRRSCVRWTDGLSKTRPVASKGKFSIISKIAGSAGMLMLGIAASAIPLNLLLRRELKMRRRSCARWVGRSV